MPRGTISSNNLFLMLTNNIKEFREKYEQSSKRRKETLCSERKSTTDLHSCRNYLPSKASTKIQKAMSSTGKSYARQEQYLNSVDSSLRTIRKHSVELMPHNMKNLQNHFNYGVEISSKQFLAKLSKKKVEEIKIRKKNVQIVDKKLEQYNLMGTSQKFFTPKRASKLELQSVNAMSEHAYNQFPITSFEQSTEVRGPLYEMKTRNNTQFIKNLKSNELFFCCHCFLYVFPIEKNRHFPECKEKPKEEAVVFEEAFHRLELIVQLARYSGLKEKTVEQLHCSLALSELATEEARWRESQVLQTKEFTDYPAEIRFFSLSEIEYAYMYTYEKYFSLAPCQRRYFCF